MVSSTTQMFANEIKIYAAISTSYDSLKLQYDPDILAAWSKDWLLRL